MSIRLSSQFDVWDDFVEIFAIKQKNTFGVKTNLSFQKVEARQNPDIYNDIHGKIFLKIKSQDPRI